SARQRRGAAERCWMRTDEDNDPPCDESGDTESIAAPPAKCCRVTKTAAVPAGDEHDNEQEEREVQPPPHNAKTTCTKPTKPSKKTPAKKASVAKGRAATTELWPR
ncbi:hypothetical protein B0H14DRAFT_2645021, partial [Mycena olivaceomarginata]